MTRRYTSCSRPRQPSKSCNKLRGTGARFLPPASPIGLPLASSFGHPAPQVQARGGETLATFTNQQCRVRSGWLLFPKKVPCPPPTKVRAVQQVRIVPKGPAYVVEVVYNVEEVCWDLDPQRCLGIDLGVSNLATGASNAPGSVPFAIKGGPVKAINQFYHKRLAHSSRVLRNVMANGIQNECSASTGRGTRKCSDITHKTSRAIINYCIEHDIGTIVIGYNPRWKHQCSLGRCTNQKFAGMPHATLVQQIRYKAALGGIVVVLVEEQYT